MSSDLPGSICIPIERNPNCISSMDCCRALAVSSVSASIAGKLKSSMYERTVVGYRRRGEWDGHRKSDHRTVEEYMTERIGEMGEPWGTPVDRSTEGPK